TFAHVRKFGHHSKSWPLSVNVWLSVRGACLPDDHVWSLCRTVLCGAIWPGHGVPLLRAQRAHVSSIHPTPVLSLALRFAARARIAEDECKSVEASSQSERRLACRSIARNKQSLQLALVFVLGGGSEVSPDPPSCPGTKLGKRCVGKLAVNWINPARAVIQQPLTHSLTRFATSLARRDEARTSENKVELFQQLLLLLGHFLKPDRVSRADCPSPHPPLSPTLHLLPAVSLQACWEPGPENQNAAQPKRALRAPRSRLSPSELLRLERGW
ncbi:hypothetical protein BaRGS_00034778, partial [Batillaria attramentaria]